MKRIFLVCAVLTAICCVTSESFAQGDNKNVVTISPAGLINKVKVQYERALSDRFSVGVSLAQYYRLFPGTQINPLARIYFTGNAPEGFYAQAQIGVYLHSYNYDGIYNDPNNPNNNYYDNDVMVGAGIGGGAGYQFLLGSSDRFVIDLMVGAKFYPIATTDWYAGSEDDLSGLWYLTGPGSLFNGRFAIGYAF